MTKHEILKRFSVDNYNLYKEDPEMLEFITGLIAEGIYRMPHQHTGLISKACQETGRKCHEHYWGRKDSAYKIIDQIRKNKSENRILSIIKSRSRVHYTTSEENTRLIKYSNLFWRNAYKLAGIELIKYVPKSRKYNYLIDGKNYDNKKDILNDYNIDINQIDYRCRSKSKKWSTWEFKEIVG